MSGPILLDEVECLGTEKNLLACEHNPIGVTDCSHSEDVGIRCIDVVRKVTPPEKVSISKDPRVYQCLLQISSSQDRSLYYYVVSELVICFYIGTLHVHVHVFWIAFSWEKFLLVLNLTSLLHDVNPLILDIVLICFKSIRFPFISGLSLLEGQNIRTFSDQWLCAKNLFLR